MYKNCVYKNCVLNALLKSFRFLFSVFTLAVIIIYDVFRKIINN